MKVQNMFGLASHELLEPFNFLLVIIMKWYQCSNSPNNTESAVAGPVWRFCH